MASPRRATWKMNLLFPGYQAVPQKVGHIPQLNIPQRFRSWVEALPDISPTPI